MKGEFGDPLTLFSATNNVHLFNEISHIGTNFDTDIHGPQTMIMPIPLTFLSHHQFLVKSHITYRVTFGTHIDFPLKMNCSHSGDPLTFQLAPSLGQNNYKINDIPISNYNSYLV